MTEGSQLCLAGPALVKAAIGQEVEPEELGGARMHAELSGTVDYLEPDDQACLTRLRSLIERLTDHRTITAESDRQTYVAVRDSDSICEYFSGDSSDEYD
jgi:acetyl-CoA carboxylase carboxyltransferase component